MLIDNSTKFLVSYWRHHIYIRNDTNTPISLRQEIDVEKKPGTLIFASINKSSRLA
jgi:hypothetical protein